MRVYKDAPAYIQPPPFQSAGSGFVWIRSKNGAGFMGAGHWTYRQNYKDVLGYKFNESMSLRPNELDPTVLVRKFRTDLPRPKKTFFAR
jgi:hypothetical protein